MRKQNVMPGKNLYAAPKTASVEFSYEWAFLQSTTPGGYPGGDDDYDDQGDF